MSALDRAQILRTRSAIAGRVAVPEWSDNGIAAEVCVRIMNVRQRRELQAGLSTESDTTGGFSPRAAALIVIATACDEDGAAIFSADDLAAIQELDARPVQRIVLEALRLNGLTRTNEDIAKNSEPSPTGA